jgi:hypothetical protein
MGGVPSSTLGTYLSSHQLDRVAAGRHHTWTACTKCLCLACEPHGRMDLRRLSHCAIPVVPTGQPFRDGWDQRYAELVDYLDMAPCERVAPHEGVHGWCDKEWFLVVPRSHYACQEVVT